MQQLLENAGYETVPFEEGADVYVINTCTVTNIADRKSRQMLHKAKKMNPDAIVVATGCYAQADTEKLKEDTAVDLILGNNQKTQIVEALEEYEKEHAKQVQVIEINHTKEYEELSIASTAEHVRAYIKVQDGCNQFCTYCIIPFARGRVRSRKIEDVLREVETLAAKGYKEVVLTGIHLSSYGVDFPKEERESLLSLIQAVSRVEGISRIRLGSLEPRIITEEFLEGIVKTGKVCPHFHLSLQSGCNKTLKNMNRRYSAQEYAEKCELIRKFYPAPALTTDVIVGFPQETEEDFEESYEFVKKIHFYETHIFKYSRRHGTKAASMDGQLTEAAKAQRSDRMLELHEIRAREYEEAMIGKKMELLLEEEIEIDGRPWYVGHSREYVRAVISKTDVHRVNDLVTVKAVAFVRDHILETKEV
ncbi:tRNA methylthiotransferase YqeV [Blautia obeum ATCC 29174]|uniref:tRNA methylthiotransferase YqeV n=2 Tax=Blautia obeum TaxID=40520 RepID=A5ZVQ9_9FIRM|nr:tRNA methylthiotransferase YqeV [Blautia obeum ATCC 29174]